MTASGAGGAVGRGGRQVAAEKPAAMRRSNAVNHFKHSALKELADQQVRFAPPAKRLEQLGYAERLLTEIDENRAYPYQFVCFRITEYRPDSYPDLLIPGAD